MSLKSFFGMAKKKEETSAAVNNKSELEIVNEKITAIESQSKHSTHDEVKLSALYRRKNELITKK